MRRYDMCKSIAAGSIMPLVFFVVMVIDINSLVKSEAPSPAGIMMTVLDFAGGGLTGFVICMLLFIPSVILTSEYAGARANAWELVRYRNRDSCTAVMIKRLLIYTVVFTAITELLKIIVLAIFTDTGMFISGGIAEYIVLDLVAGFTFYYRGLMIYHIIRNRTSHRAASVVATVIIYFIEYIVYTYILYQSPACPCHVLTIPFRVMTGETTLTAGVMYILASLMIDAALSVWLVAGMRRKDVMDREG